MFGISAFAQPPFATINNTGFFLNITENIDVADSNSQTWTFGQVIAENVTMNDINSQAGIFIGTIVETLSSGDSSSQLSTYLQILT